MKLTLLVVQPFASHGSELEIRCSDSTPGPLTRDRSSQAVAASTAQHRGGRLNLTCNGRRRHTLLSGRTCRWLKVCSWSSHERTCTYSLPGILHEENTCNEHKTNADRELESRLEATATFSPRRKPAVSLLLAVYPGPNPGRTSFSFIATRTGEIIA